MIVLDVCLDRLGASEILEVVPEEILGLRVVVGRVAVMGNIFFQVAETFDGLCNVIPLDEGADDTELLIAEMSFRCR